MEISDDGASVFVAGDFVTVNGESRQRAVNLSMAAGASSAVVVVSGGVLGGPAVELSGTATDDVAVGTVWVAIRDRDTGQWLQPDGVSFGGVYALVAAALDTPGTTSTD